MAECIEREAVFSAIWKTSAEHDVFFPAIILDAIKSIPAADVRPVVRGKWLWAHGKKARYCSRCYHDEPYKFADEDADIYNFCPNCGADMRRTRDDKP